VYLGVSCRLRKDRQHSGCGAAGWRAADPVAEEAIWGF